MEELKTQLRYSAQRGVISLVSGMSSSLQIGVRSGYVIVLDLEHTSNLDSDSVLVLRIPLAYQGRIGACLPSPCTITTT